MNKKTTISLFVLVILIVLSVYIFKEGNVSQTDKLTNESIVGVWVFYERALQNQIWQYTRYIMDVNATVGFDDGGIGGANEEALYLGDLSIDVSQTKLNYTDPILNDQLAYIYEIHLIPNKQILEVYYVNPLHEDINYQEKYTSGDLLFSIDTEHNNKIIWAKMFPVLEENRLENDGFKKVKVSL